MPDLVPDGVRASRNRMRRCETDELYHLPSANFATYQSVAPSALGYEFVCTEAALAPMKYSALHHGGKRQKLHPRLRRQARVSVWAASVYCLESSADVEIRRQLGVGETGPRRIENQDKSSTGTSQCSSTSTCPRRRAQKSLCSSVMSDSGSSPTQARKMLVRAARCLARALTTGVPGGVSGALSM